MKTDCGTSDAMSGRISGLDDDLPMVSMYTGRLVATYTTSGEYPRELPHLLTRKSIVVPDSHILAWHTSSIEARLIGHGPSGRRRSGMAPSDS